jgi:hypothetical protein
VTGGIRRRSRFSTPSTPERRPRDAGDERGDTSPGVDGDGDTRPTDAGEHTDEPPTTDPRADDLPDPTGGGSGDPIDDALRGWRYGRTDAEREASRQVAERATAWLRETPLDEVRKSDVPVEELADDDPEGRTADTLWTQVVRDAWKHAVDRGDIDQPTSRTYQWVGDDETE